MKKVGHWKLWLVLQKLLQILQKRFKTRRRKINPMFNEIYCHNYFKNILSEKHCQKRFISNNCWHLISVMYFLLKLFTFRFILSDSESMTFAYFNMKSVQKVNLRILHKCFLLVSKEVTMAVSSANCNQSLDMGQFWLQISHVFNTFRFIGINKSVNIEIR